MYQTAKKNIYLPGFHLLLFLRLPSFCVLLFYLFSPPFVQASRTSFLHSAGQFVLEDKRQMQQPKNKNILSKINTNIMVLKQLTALAFFSIIGSKMGLSLLMHELLTTAEHPITTASFVGMFVLFFSTCVIICSASFSSKTLGRSD